MGREYIGVQKISGPLIFIQGVTDVGYGEMVEIVSPTGELRHGMVLATGRDVTVVEVYEETAGLSTAETKVRFLGKPFEILVSREMLGRIFNGLCLPLDGAPPLFEGERRNINGLPINPTSRAYPRDFIQTGISAIDGMNTLVRGQKLPIFSGSGLPHNRLAAQIVRQAQIPGMEQEFAIVFAAMGIQYEVADFFRRSFEESGALKNVVMFLNLASDPSIERIVTPRVALTAAEYLAFEENMHLLVVLTDMTNYCEALREVATAKGEIPSRKGYPGYLYSDLASIYERAGRLNDREGSITQIPILTMPDDDITHPIPDLTGYITEGQMVLDRSLYIKGIYPPINVLPSLSRLMSDGIGKDRTRADHSDISSQLYASYARAKGIERLATIMGEEELSSIDKQYLKFSEEFERRFVNQGETVNRSIFETLDLAWEMACILPERELTRVTDEEIKIYGRKK